MNGCLLCHEHVNIMEIQLMSLGKTQTFQRLGRTVLDASSRNSRSSSGCAGLPLQLVGEPRLGVPPPHPALLAQTGESRDTDQNNTCQNAERRRAEKKTSKRTLERGAHRRESQARKLAWRCRTD